MYYSSYQNPKNKKNLNFIVLILLIIIILGLISFFLFSEKFKQVLNKTYSKSYIDNLINHKEYDKALKILLKNINSSESINWWYFYKIGIIYYYESDYLNSLLYLRSANFYADLEKIPLDINFYIGDNYYKLGKSYYQYAIKYFEKYSKVVNTSKSLIMEQDFYYKLSIMYVEVEEYDKARKIMQKIYSNFQNDYKFLYYYSLVLLNDKKIEESLKILKKIGSNTNDLDLRKDSLFLQGKIYVDLEEYKKAIEYFLQCVDISPNSDTSYYYLGYCYSQLHDSKTAINYLTKAIIINSNNELAKNLLKAIK